MYLCDFWHKFNIYLLDKQIVLSSLMEKYQELLKDIFLGFLKLLKYDNNVFIELNKQKTKIFKNNDSYKDTEEYRTHLKVFFADMSNLYGFQTFYDNILFPQITESINFIKKDLTDITAWSYLEGLLYCFMSISRSKINI